MPNSSTERACPACRPEPFWHVLWRFLWPFRYFHDVSEGSWLERVQSYRHNRAMRIYLPGFILKWAALTALWLCFGGVLDQTQGLVIAAAACFMTATYTALVVVILLVIWVWLVRFPELY